MTTGIWLLEPSVAARMAAATPADIAALRATGPENSFWDPEKVYRRAGANAAIEVRGVLTRDRDYMAAFFAGGNTTYDDLINALARAEQDPEVERIQLYIDSPGGQVAGLFALIDAMRAATKPIDAIGYNTVASAAYAIAANADTFKLANQAVAVGSVGIAQRFSVDKDSIMITSSNAPDKAPDAETAEGQEVIRAQLDEIEVLFIDSIAEGRGVTAETVRNEYGRGRVYLSAQAVQRGMADAILQTSSNKTATTGGATGEGSTMDLAKLKAEHPAVYAAAVQLGHDAGVTAERERVAAHLTLADASGDMATAIAAINSGDGLTTAISAKHQAAAMKRAEANARIGDNAAAAAAAGAEGDAPAPAAKSMMDQVAEALDSELEG